MSRFTFSSEPYAQERVVAVQESIEELKIQYSEIISGVLFGSLSKGTARIDSDIDLYVFINPDELIQKETLVYRRMNFVRNDFDNRRQFTMAYVDFKQEIKDIYTSLVRNKIKEKLSDKISDEQLKDIIVEPLNESILTYELQELIDSYSIHPDQQEEDGELEIESIKHFTETYPITSPQGASVKAGDQLWYLFSCDIGGDLGSYRKFAIKYLSGHGMAGELAWKNIIRNIEIWEQKAEPKDLPTTTDYPRTLEEARKLFT